MRYLRQKLGWLKSIRVDIVCIHSKKGEEWVVVHAMAVLELAMFIYTWGLGFGVAREASEDVTCMWDQKFSSF